MLNSAKPRPRYTGGTMGGDLGGVDRSKGVGGKKDVTIGHKKGREEICDN